MFRNKIIVLILILSLVFSSCAKNDEFANSEVKNEVQDKKTDKKLKILATTFPQYDWVREIAGDKLADIDLTLLLDNGVDLHSYSATADDIIMIKESDLFIYVGGHSDAWVDEVLEAGDSKVKAFNMLEALGLSEDEEHENEEHEHEEHEHEEHEEHEHEEHEEHEHEEGEHHHHADEHVWLSLRHAQVLVKALADDMAKIDTENAEVYKENADNYVKKLGELDKEYEEIVASAARNTVLFGDRFPFHHMFEDYGLEHFSAFSACSAESEASFEKIAFLASKIDELDLSKVLTIEGGDKKLADTIISTSSKDAKILEINSMQSVTKEALDKGAKYFDIMKKNAEVLREALE